MCPLVNLQVPRLREGLVTLGTGIWFLSGVDSHGVLKLCDSEKDLVHLEQE